MNTLKALKILSTTLRECHLIDSNPYVLSDMVWERILFIHKPDNRIIKVLHYWTIKDDYVYVISFGTTQDRYFNFIPIIYKIISGVGILTKNTHIFHQVTLKNPLSVSRSVCSKISDFGIKFWGKIEYLLFRIRIILKIII